MQLNDEAARAVSWRRKWEARQAALFAAQAAGTTPPPSDGGPSPVESARGDADAPPSGRRAPSPTRDVASAGDAAARALGVCSRVVLVGAALRARAEPEEALELKAPAWGGGADGGVTQTAEECARRIEARKGQLGRATSKEQLAEMAESIARSMGESLVKSSPADASATEPLRRQGAGLGPGVHGRVPVLRCSSRAVAQPPAGTPGMRTGAAQRVWGPADASMPVPAPPWSKADA